MAPAHSMGDVAAFVRERLVPSASSMSGGMEASAPGRCAKVLASEPR